MEIEIHNKHMYNDRQLREIFHFCFLDRFIRASDPRLYVLKGGVNLRFFFHSPRYSEDMGLDVLAGNVTTLAKNVYKIFSDAAFMRSLKSFGIEGIKISDPNKAKQTQTTQRFRARLVTTSGDQLPTKIEFSRRTTNIADAAFDKIDPDIARAYRKLSYSCQHYSGHSAVVQKIRALAGRAVTQARDVFDLAILHAAGYVKPDLIQHTISLTTRQQAINNLLGLSFQDYTGQVVEFLDTEIRKDYDQRIAWETMQETVLSQLSDEYSFTR